MIGIHSVGKILTTFLEPLIPISFEMNPYLRLIVVIAEVFYVVYIFKRIAFKNIYERETKQVIKILVISITLYVIGEFGVDSVFCPMGENLEEYYDNKDIVNNAEKIIFAIAIVVITIINLKQNLKSN